MHIYHRDAEAPEGLDTNMDSNRASADGAE